jgi:glyoxylase I family protein
MPLHITGLVPLLQVFDMNESIRFYRDMLGFEMVSHSPEIEAAEGRYFHWAWLRLGGAEVMLNTAYDAGERPAIREAARWRGHEDTALYIGCPDVDGAHAYLRSKGLSIDPPVIAPYGMKQLYVRDPDGYILCFQAPVGER